MSSTVQEARAVLASGGASMVVRCQDGSMEFRFYRSSAHSVDLVGDFNGWNKRFFPMQTKGDGWWTYRLHLGPGVYQFKYLADSRWYPDYAAFGLERGPFGWNSVVVVDESAPASDTRNRRSSR